MKRLALASSYYACSNIIAPGLLLFSFRFPDPQRVLDPTYLSKRGIAHVWVHSINDFDFPIKG